MPTLQYIIRCSKGRPTCVTITKCCCFDDMLRGVPASGAPVTVKLGDTTIASGSADSDGKFCFEPCVGGAYTLILGEQGVCAESSQRWDVGPCGAGPITATQAGQPGYACCNGVQIPAQFIFTDANGSWPGGNAFVPDLPHAGDAVTDQQIGYLKWTSSTPIPCLMPVTGGICTLGDDLYSGVGASVFESNTGPFGYSYGITCGRDEAGAYLEFGAAWAFTAENSNDYYYPISFCCNHGGIMTPFDCRIGSDLGDVNYEISAYGYCIPTPPQPYGPCKTHVWPAGGIYVATTIPSRIYLGDPCTLQSGPWTFTLEPGPDPITGVTPAWQYEIDFDCQPGGIAVDRTIAPPPPGGPSVTVSGYFP